MVEFPDDVRLISLKSRFDACLECQGTVLSKLNFKKSVCKKGVYKQWNGLLDWNTGMDYWNDIFLVLGGLIDSY